ncbi:ATPase [Devosia geojensis]|uniref:ATPase n=1 Tax=Devosia geojensis TaxID=443610 RepID=A0A0F5FZD7_9HYPH|nr:AAA family ATPase [Devosia geojensis]KKB13542.1 ATPase [Devosia geojensis]
MSLTDIEIIGYRSVRAIRFPVRRLSVLVGGNGVGKTNLYRALELVHAAARGTLAEEIAREGGMASVFWAGERKVGDQSRLSLKVEIDDIGAEMPAAYEAEFGFAPGYQVEVGFRVPTAAAFPLEAQIKREALTIRMGRREVTVLERKGGAAWVRDTAGRRSELPGTLLASETALANVRGFAEIDAVRQTLAAWRFYHGFRTDADSPLRRPALAVAAPLLNADGSNLAAVFATLRHIRQDTIDLDAAIEHAFPGASLDVPVPQENATFSMTFPDLPRRPFAARELSDGTLQFLALLGALLSYRLPPLVALNEPETSLHPSLLPALARTIARAAERTQVWVVTHSRELADALETEAGIAAREVVRRDGATWLEGLSPLGIFADEE